jgi:hypothetical protein
MDQPEDYPKLGVSPNGVEKWEDRRRSEDAAGTWEWWYFDSMLEDGSQAVVQFFTKDNPHIGSSELHPTLRITITAPDGTKHDATAKVPADQARYGAEQCDVAYGPHLFQGDFSDYRIRVAETDGLAADLTLHSRSKAFRPGTAYFGFGDHDEKFYTWLCAVPAGEVSGILTYGGKAHEVHGRGYHDHQWGTVPVLEGWNHWTWSRQSFDDLAILVFDMTANREYGYTRFPLCFVQDAEGNVVFQNTRDVDYSVLSEYTDPSSGKVYPKDSRYIFDNEMGRAEYTLRQESVIESMDIRSAVGGQLKAKLGETPARWLTPFLVKSASRKMAAKGLNPSYARYSGHGELLLTPAKGQATEREGTLIYEFMYPGMSYKDAK